MHSQEIPLPHLVERSGPNAGRKHLLPHGAHVVGRERGVDIMLEGPDVSRRHARLEVGPDAVRVVDLESKNGIAVDGRDLEPREVADVEHGSTIELGGLRLELVHPASRLDRALRQAGEVTVTHRRVRDSAPVERRGLLVPALSLLLFGAAAFALWWFG